MNKEKFLIELKEFLPQLHVLQNELMSKHTSFRVGGPADFFIVPKTEEEVIHTLNLTKKFSLPLTVLGNGSNVLVKDKGIRGVVLKFCGGKNVTVVEDEILSCSAGVLLSSAANAAAEASLSGLEFAGGIPGSVGGGVFMNAGAYNGEFKDVLLDVSAIDLDGNKYTLTVDKLKLCYRHSIFADNGHIITNVRFKLSKGDKKEIKSKIQEFNQRRSDKQPLDLPSAGSTFKRPEGSYASKLIDEAGLRGFMVGGAQISEKHAGFIVNKNQATAGDILRLIEQVQEKVKTEFGIDLQTEVKIIGE